MVWYSIRKLSLHHPALKLNTISHNDPSNIKGERIIIAEQPLQGHREANPPSKGKQERHTFFLSGKHKICHKNIDNGLAPYMLCLIPSFCFSKYMTLAMNPGTAKASLNTYLISVIISASMFFIVFLSLYFLQCFVSIICWKALILGSDKQLLSISCSHRIVIRTGEMDSLLNQINRIIRK